MESRDRPVDERSPRLDELIEEHLPGLRAYLRVHIGGLVQAKESSSDLLQSVCREVIEHARRFEHPGDKAFRQWLYRTAERKVIDRFRYYTAEKRHVGREAAGLDPADSALASLARQRSAATSERAIAREDLARARAAFDALAPHYQEVIVLYQLQGLTHRQIAERLGRSDGAVRNILYRGLATISAALDG